MTKFLNEKPFGHLCRFGTEFKAKRCDFQGGLTAHVPAHLTVEQILSDGIQVGGWHGVNIWTELNGFGGYDYLRIKIVPKQAEISGEPAHLPVPDDYADPEWAEGGRVHNWRNHVPEVVRTIWHTFTDRQQQLLALWATELASREEWE